MLKFPVFCHPFAAFGPDAEPDFAWGCPDAELD